mgnify:CR=1 FL=1
MHPNKFGHGTQRQLRFLSNVALAQNLRQIQLRWCVLLGVLLLMALTGCSSGGGSAPSGTQVAASVTVPSAPTNIIATSGDGRVSLNFTNAADGGSPITAYIASCNSSSGTVSASGAAAPLLITGLVNGTPYSCTIQAKNAAGTGVASAAISVTPQISSAFDGSVVLGAPTTNTVRMKLFSATQSGSVIVAFGATSQAYSQQLHATNLTAGTPVELTLDGLKADTQYFYRLQITTSVGTINSPEASFHTARPTGSTFTFTVQADSHLDENSDLNIYRRTLANVVADKPDFHIDLGDTFMTEKYSVPLTANSQRAADSAAVDTRYIYERGNFGLLNGTPLFLANGNHDGELGWLNNGTQNSIAIWTTAARKKFFSPAYPDSFYSGDSVVEPFVGQRGSWYSWTWGDALFVVLDPYWASTASSGWGLTLGDRQYRWLAQTLADSTANFKFVFLHSLVGGLDGAMRGGVEAAPYFEWGGKSLDGTYDFPTRRPGWSMPIHQLLVKNHVTAVFHGHDHVYVHQTLDGIHYQETPQPSAINSQSGASLAASYHYASGTIQSSSGHLRVTVSPKQVKVDYVRAWLPSAETAQRKNGQIDDSWTVSAP